MERFDLYTWDRVKTGKTMARGGPRPEGLYRLTVHVCVFDTHGRMLIQQRQPFKDGWSNYWDISVGGCVVAGESSREAAERETREELGLSIDLANARPVLTVHFAGGFNDIYTVTRDVELGDLRLQYEEVKAARWATQEEILRMIDEGSFIPYERNMIGLLFFLRNRRGVQTKKDPGTVCEVAAPGAG